MSSVWRVVTIQATRAAAAVRLVWLAVRCAHTAGRCNRNEHRRQFPRVVSIESNAAYDAREFLQGPSSLPNSCAAVAKELLTLWVSYPWYKAWKNEWRGAFDPEAIWIRPPIDEDGFLRDMLIPGCLQSD